MVQDTDQSRLGAALAIVRQATAQLDALHARYSPAQRGVALRAVAERLYQERRRRDEYFPRGLFGEPAWDLLLALFIAHEDGKSLTLEKACAAARLTGDEAAPVIDKLAGAGLVERSRCDWDKRRNCLLLTRHATERLSDYLSALL